MRFLSIPLLAVLLTWAAVGRSQELVPSFDSESKKWGFSEKGTGVFAIGADFDYAGTFPKDAPAIVVKGEKYFFVNRQGRPAFDRKFEFAGDFRDGLAPVKVGGKFGMIDLRGELAIPAEFDYLSSNSNSLIRFRKAKKFGFISPRGKIVVEPNYELVGEFSDGRAWFRKGAKFGYLDTEGRTVIEPRYDAADDYSAGRAAVRIDGKYGFIDKSGELVVEPRYDAVRPFTAVRIGNTPLSATRLNGRWGVIDPKGKVVLEHRAEGVVGRLGMREGTNVSVIAGIGKDNTLLMERAAIPELIEVALKSKPIPVEVYVVDKYAFDEKDEQSWGTLLTPMNRLPEGDPSAPPNDDPTVKALLNKNKKWVVLFVKRNPDNTFKIEPRPCRPKSALDPYPVQLMTTVSASALFTSSMVES